MSKKSITSGTGPLLGGWCFSQSKGAHVLYTVVLCLQQSSSRVRRSSAQLLLTSITVLVTARVARRWNQTGQKFAGEPDIARTFFSGHKAALWLAVTTTYLWNLRSLGNHGFSHFSRNVSGGIGTVLATASATFKIAFTTQDSPELMAGYVVASELGVSLVTRARIVFAVITLSLIYTLATGFGLPKRPNRKSLIYMIYYNRINFI